MSILTDSNETSHLPASCSRTLEKQNFHNSLFSVPEAFEFCLLVVNDLVFAKRGKYLTDAELVVMRGALNNLDYEEIAHNSNYTVNYLQRCVAPLLWDTLSETIGNGDRVGKKKLRQILEELNQKYHIQSPFEPYLALSSSDNSSLIIRGQLPEISNFYGRIHELNLLKELIFKHRCITLLGVAGVGKSSLATKLIVELSKKPRRQFDALIWKSLSHIPSLPELTHELIALIQPSLVPELPLSSSTHNLISILIQQLQSCPCLLVLDGFEALFQRSNFTQRLEYSIFLNRLIDEASPSCLLLTTRFLPDELNILIKNNPSTIKVFKVNGLDIDAATQLLSDLGLQQEENYQSLINTYWGNPLELKNVVSRIERFFAGSTLKFLENKTTLISLQLQTMLNEMFGQVLSDLQRRIMICITEELVLTSQPISFAKLLTQLRQLPNLPVSTSELITDLEKLERLSLIESGKDNTTKEITFTLQPVVKKYINTDPAGLVHPSEQFTPYSTTTQKNIHAH
ncbi:NACHT domain-containing protein [Anabaena sp. CCY 9910]|uniref:NACHT domain-containing protein n=1 Tax=Anabaena sp. CCY 9910 TaxID=3103870 RepID=UPI0039E1007A